ncbi:MAG: GNAT family N-acetyltransferase [Bacteriovorax sp.]
MIRPIKRSDYRSWKKFYSGLDPSKSKYDLTPRPKEQCDFKSFITVIDRHSKVADEDKCYIYGAFSKESNVLIGIVDIYVISRGCYEMANLGYRVGNHYWNKGYGAEMVKKVFDFLKEDLSLHRLEAAINLDNKASINLAKSSGMKREGIKRGYIFEDNRWVDHVIYVYLANPTSKI